MHFNIDADLICWKTASITDGKYYSVHVEGVEYINVKKSIINDKCDKHGINKNEITTCFDPEPIENCLGNMKRLIRKITSHPRCNSYNLFLSDKTNYRYDIFPDYKANRRPEINPNIRIPANLKKAKEYLLNYWDAKILENCEADDYLGIKQCTEEDQCIVTTDKDLNCIPGYHYNWDKDKLFYVTEEEGWRNFYTQMIKGDTSDHIPGLSEKAPKRRTYSLKPLRFLRTQEEMEEYVFEGYAIKYCDNAKEMMNMNGKLLYILKDYEDSWEVSII